MHDDRLTGLPVILCTRYASPRSQTPRDPGGHPSRTSRPLTGTAVWALAASFYVGACIGSLIKASAEVYGSIAAAKLVGFLTSIGTALGTPVANYVGRAMQRNPMMAPMRVSVVQAR